MLHRSLVVGIFVSACILCANAGSHVASGNTIVETVINSTVHSTLETLVIKAGLVTTLQGDGKFTLFAPTDAAFTALETSSKVLYDKLTGDAQWVPLLAEVLKFHVLEQTDAAVLAADLPATATDYPTLASDGSVLTIKAALGDQITAKAPATGSSDVALADLESGNGVVHAISKVLLPMSAVMTVVDLGVADTEFSTLVDLLTLADLVTTLNVNTSAFTVFAPPNAAFTALETANPGLTAKLKLPANKAKLVELLKFHVVSGVTVSSDLSDGAQLTTLEGSKITYTTSGGVNGVAIADADILALNGVIHEVDEVLLPNDDFIASVVYADTIVGTVVESVSHETLQALVTKAGLLETLAGDGKFTLFAPDDAAFTALETSSKVLYDKIAGSDAQWVPLLAEVLKFHVLEKSDAAVLAADLPAAATDYPTLAADGSVLTIKAALGDQITAKAPATGSSNVTVPDLVSGNGVVHSISSVLLPMSAVMTIVDLGVADTEFSTLVELLGLGEMVQKLSDNTGAFTVFAPPNAAFTALETANPGLTAKLKLPANKAKLAQLLKFHVVSGVTVSSDLSDGAELTTLHEGSKITYTTAGVNGVAIADADLLALNGVVHAVAGVLVPAGFVASLDADTSTDTAETVTFKFTLVGANSPLDSEVKAALTKALADEMDVDESKVTLTSAAIGRRRLLDASVTAAIETTKTKAAAIKTQVQATDFATTISSAANNYLPAGSAFKDALVVSSPELVVAEVDDDDSAASAASGLSPACATVVALSSSVILAVTML